MDVNDDQEGEQIEVEVNAPFEHSSDDESLDELIEPHQELEESPTPSEPDDDAQHFDIALAAEHTYMGESFSSVGSAAVVEAGQDLVVLGLAAPSVVFPGELVPLRLSRAAARILLQHPDKLLVLLVPDSSGARVSGLGALCEVAEARAPAPDGAVSVKARAVHRVAVRADAPLYYHDSPFAVSVRVLAEGGARCSVRAAAPRLRRLLAAAAAARDYTHRHSASGECGRRAGCGRRCGSRRERLLLASAAAGTPWPAFVFDAYSVPRLRARLADHFQHQNIAPLPEECGALAARACADVSLSYAQRLALLREDGAAARIVLLLRMLAQSRMLYCATCGSTLAARRDEIVMTSAGVHAHYANPGGYTHDVVTLRTSRGLTLAGPPSAEYSWFPGYTWQVAMCAACQNHKGWRFEAISRRLVPRHFVALCRNYVSPHPPAGPLAPRSLHLSSDSEV